MVTALAIENIDPTQLSIEESYAFAILKNLPVEQVNQLKQLMKLGKPGAIGPATLTAFIQLCHQQGFDLSIAGVSAFKDKHRLNNTGAYQGVIGPQTAGVYFQEVIANSHTTTTADLNAAILTAAQSLRDMCTTDGPDGGNNACAWSLNRVLSKAGIAPLGDNPNYVPSLFEALQNGRGKEISPADAKAGDLVVAFGEAHIGVGLDNGCHRVLSNSSSRALFAWESDTDFDDSYGGPSTIFRLVR
ncbi:MAG: hypothetical protein KME45_24960 [Stenomitos rutilans HA7619-LM2]|jgi:hypothetical protein|nr:hypothetical protein [Stenomitos rutilans HA7619-LM2]